MRGIRLAALLLLLSALPAGLAAQAAGTVQLSSATLSDTTLLLICLFGAAGAWLLRRPSRALREKEKGQDPGRSSPPSMTQTARR